MNDHPQKRITREIIAAIPDKELAWKVWEHIWLRVDKNYKDLAKILATLPPGFLTIYHLFVLDGEIANGGFNQYFFNQTDRTADQQLTALKLIGAKKHQAVFEKAFALRDEEKGDKELQNLYAERTLESFSKSYKRTSLGECDRQWSALEAQFHEQIATFVHANVELFVDPE